ncbi:MAG TPA: hypothetical protein VI423_12000 [Paenisporosarcina sp.]|nr:hypothetical protein [Paenisporosarcina sp.]
MKELITDPSKVLVIHYSQLKTAADDHGGISPLILAIVVKTLDGSSEHHFCIHLEADKANLLSDEVSSSYRDLELRVLKAYNDFVRRHNDCIWVHWEMKNVSFGFDAIRHRFDKIFGGLSGQNDRYEEIPTNKKVNLCSLMEDMYGENFADGPDKLASLFRTNNHNVLNYNYLTIDAEGSEFEKQNFTTVMNSLDCKVNFIRKAIKRLSAKNLSVQNKNSYAIFIETVNHPLFNFIGWTFGLAGLVLTIYSFL